ncbi:winged helix-turn-helix transcriptional regulator [Roseibium algae]|uniref:Helix-turn-helix domain-containing protein n=1 Tax=Roseibium algae TaxID=3123038 RepID=A0ABU8TMA0_9HYPH
MLPVTAITREDAEHCPVRSVLGTVNGKWQSLLILALEDGDLRFSAIKRLLGDISQRVLTENLRMLERDGYVTRTVTPGPPVAVSYGLTPMGRSMLETLKPMVLWAAENFSAVQKARLDYDQM